MGEFIGWMLIMVALVAIYEELHMTRKAMEGRDEKVDPQRCDCQICDGKVPTMEERA